MATTFYQLNIGDSFNVPGYPAKHDGILPTFTKTSATKAVDEFGREWSFVPSLAIGVNNQPGSGASAGSASSSSSSGSGSGSSGTGTTTGPAGPAGAPGANGLNVDLVRKSNTSNTIGLGSFSFTFTQSSLNLGWTVGTRLRAADANTPTNFLEGIVTAVSSSTVTFTADTTGGSGTPGSWNIFVAGNPGATGATGPAGPGVPVGGTANQVLAKIDATNYNTQWVNPSGGADVLQVQVFS